MASVLAALAWIPNAWAAEGDDAVRALTQPTSSVEAGGIYVTNGSSKFGEYNGLDKQGGYFLGNLEVFGSGGADSAFRWRILGYDVGLDTRNIMGEAGDQGRWRITLGYDQIPKRYADTFVTLWNGAGTTSLTLPAGYPPAATRLAVTNNAAGILANWNNIQTPNATASSVGGGPAFVIPQNMHGFTAGTDRKRYNAGASVELPAGWEFKASARHEDKDGTKLTGVNIGRFSGVSAIVPEPIDNSHDQFDVSIAYTGEQATFSLGYYGSIFRNNINLWTVENPGANNAVMNNVARLMAPPDNQMHQVNLAASYRFNPTTKLIVTGSYARLTQDEAFIDAPAGSTWVYPASSANAKVVNTFFLARLVSRPLKDLALNATYRYEDRDNKTPLLTFLTTGGDSPGASTQFTNTPLSRKLQQLNLDAVYSLGRGQSVKGEYERQNIHRTANGEESPFRADKTYEDTFRLGYRKTMGEQLTGRIDYSHSRRHLSEYEEGNPQPANPPSPLPAADPALTGFEQFFLADRNRDKVRSLLAYDATERISLQGGLDYTNDRYPHNEFGLKKSEGWTLNLDGAYAASDTLSFSGFYTYEHNKIDMDSLAIARGTTATTLVPHVSGPPCAPYTNVANTLPADYFTDPCRQWAQSQADRVHTLGAGVKYSGLMSGRLVLSGDATYAYARTPINVSGGTYYNNGVPNSPTGNVFIGATPFDDITSKRIDIQLAALYAIDKPSAVRLTYWYSHLDSSDWAYDAYTNSPLGVLSIQNYLGPGITSPNYTVHVIGLSYIYRWQ
jgi:MtrB/PioB family decaheme-associated outer membrane protein